MDRPHLSQFPGVILRVVDHVGGDIARYDVVVRVLLDNVDAVKLVLAGKKLLDEPGPVVGPIAEELASQAGERTGRLRIFEQFFVSVFAMRRHRVIQGGAARGCEKTGDKKRREE